MAHALDLIGERWALLIVRELLLGPKRFTDLRAGLPGASADVLTQRLRGLIETGIVKQAKLPPPAASKVYGLTAWGAELEPVVTHLGRWGSRSPSMNHDADRSVDSLVLSLGALFDSKVAHGFAATIELRLGENTFRVEIADGRIHLARGDAEQPTATLVTDPTTLAALIYGDRPLDDSVRSGEATITGKAAAVGRLLRLVRLPEPANAR